MAGITGTRAIAADDVKAALTRLRASTKLPVSVGFGIRTPEQAATVARFADGVIVGTAIVARIFECVGNKLARGALVSNVAEFCTSLAKSVHAERDTV
jgi:tryptophan synthase alpha chain